LKKLLLALVLSLASVSARAEWRVVWVGNDIGLTVYADLSTIERTGNEVKMWEIMDYRSVQEAGDNYLSSKSLRVYDCEKEQFGLVAFWVYSGHMASGSVVYSSDVPGKLRPVEPDSIGETLWTTACNSH
jgi:hypothetical protein